MRSETVRVHLALITTSLIYGYFYVAVKLLLKTLSPAEFILLRFVLTAAIVSAVDRFCLKRPPIAPEDRFQLTKLGLIGVFLVQILVAVGVHQTTAFHSALIMAAIPIITLLFSIAKGVESFHSQKLVGIATGFIGVTILLFFSSTPGAGLPSSYLIGDFIVLLNACAFSWFLLGSGEVLKKYTPFSFMSYCYIVSAALFSLLFFSSHLIQGGSLGLDFLQRLSTTEWLLIAYVVLFASIGSYTLNNYALKRVNPSIVAIYIFIQPIISAVTGFYLLGDPFNAQMAVATVITFVGVFLATSPQLTVNAMHSFIQDKRRPPQTPLPGGRRKDDPPVPKP